MKATGDVLISGGKTTLVIATGKDTTGVSAVNLTMTKGELSITGAKTKLVYTGKTIADEAIYSEDGERVTE